MQPIIEFEISEHEYSGGKDTVVSYFTKSTSNFKRLFFPFSSSGILNTVWPESSSYRSKFFDIENQRRESNNNHKNYFVFDI